MGRAAVFRFDFSDGSRSAFKRDQANVPTCFLFLLQMLISEAKRKVIAGKFTPTTTRLNLRLNSPFASSRRGRPPKQGLSSLSSYEDFNEEESMRLKKYRVDDKDSSSHDDLNGESTLSSRSTDWLTFVMTLRTLNDANFSSLLIIR